MKLSTPIILAFVTLSIAAPIESSAIAARAPKTKAECKAMIATGKAKAAAGVQPQTIQNPIDDWTYLLIFSLL